MHSGEPKIFRGSSVWMLSSISNQHCPCSCYYLPWAWIQQGQCSCPHARSLRNSKAKQLWAAALVVPFSPSVASGDGDRGPLVPVLHLCLDLKDMTWPVLSDGLVTPKSPCDEFKLWLNFVLILLAGISCDSNCLRSLDFLLHLLGCQLPISTIYALITLLTASMRRQ